MQHENINTEAVFTQPYRLGLPMWSNRQWIGSLFPKGSNSSNFLQHYSQVFSSVEGNTTFYALPDKNTVASWKEQADSNFKFCFKLPRKVTHENYLRYCGAELSEFFTRLEPLANVCGSFMIQLPESFEPRSINDLARFIDVLPKGFQFSVEVRHLDFFNQGAEEKALNQLLSENNIDRVCFDSRALFSKPAVTEQEKDAHRKKPKLPVHATATAKNPIVRFIGGSDMTRNNQYLLPWIKKLEQWRQQDITPTIFIHTPDNVAAPEQAFSFHQQLEHIAGWQPLAKALSEIEDDSQLSIF